MSEAIPPLPQYAFMAWCSVKSLGVKHGLLPLRKVHRLRVFENKALRIIQSNRKMV
jgi:hypothetical protein